MNKKLYTGENGLIGDIEHMMVPNIVKQSSSTEPSYMGMFLSEDNILNEYKYSHRNINGTICDLVESYQKQEPLAVQLIHNFEYYLTICLNNIVALYNPETIILDSQVLKECPEILDSIKCNLSCSVCSSERIRLSTLDLDASLKGGIFIAIKNFLTDYMKQYPKQQDFNISV